MSILCKNKVSQSGLATLLEGAGCVRNISTISKNFKIIYGVNEAVKSERKFILLCIVCSRTLFSSNWRVFNCLQLKPYRSQPAKQARYWMDLAFTASDAKAYLTAVHRSRLNLSCFCCCNFLTTFHLKSCCFLCSFYLQISYFSFDTFFPILFLQLPITLTLLSIQPWWLRG